MRTRLFALLLFASTLFTGCTTTITNLTARQQDRNPSGLYPFEVAWDSHQSSIHQNSIKAFVIIGLNAYPMQHTQMIKNRWETLVPIPASQEYVSYRYKFEYQYSRIPEPRWSSKLSPTYQLKVVEKYQPPPLPPTPVPTGAEPAQTHP